MEYLDSSTCSFALLQSDPMHKANSRSLKDALLPSTENDPCGAYPAPDTSMIFSQHHNLVTVISFLVSVPVLSEQMIVTEPSASVAGSFFMIMFFLASRRAPMAREMVMIAGRLLGMAATARLRENTKSGPMISDAGTCGSLLITLAMNTIATST